LREKHTRKHIRDFHYTPFFHEHDTEGKVRQPREVALEKFKKIYDTHRPEPLPESVLKELDRILAIADQTEKALGN
jgi:hypothetical protein